MPSIPFVLRKCWVLIALAIFNIVLLIWQCNLFVAMQNFRFRPNNSLQPIGRVLSEQRLWKARFVGCWNKCEAGCLTALLKLVCMFKSGFDMKPKVARQYFDVFWSLFLFLMFSIVFFLLFFLFTCLWNVLLEEDLFICFGGMGC